MRTIQCLNCGTLLSGPEEQGPAAFTCVGCGTVVVFTKRGVARTDPQFGLRMLAQIEREMDAVKPEVPSLQAMRAHGL